MPLIFNAKEITNRNNALTFDDVLLVPQHSQISSRRAPSLTTKLTKNWTIDLPIVSSNMDTFKGKIVSDKKILSQVISKIQSNKVIKRKKMLFIRKHPSEKYHKYKYLKNLKSKLIIKIDKNFALKDSFKDTSLVIGYDSMALVVAKIYGLKTINLYVDKKNNKIPKKYIDYYLKIKK